MLRQDQNPNDDQDDEDEGSQLIRAPLLPRMARAEAEPEAEFEQEVQPELEAVAADELDEVPTRRIASERRAAPPPISNQQYLSLRPTRNQASQNFHRAESTPQRPVAFLSRESIPSAPPIDRSIPMSERLHQAILMQDVTPLKNLLQGGACRLEALRSQNPNGETILHIAVRNRRRDQVSAILAAPAYADSLLHIENNNGKEVWDLVLANNMYDAFTAESVAGINAAIAREEARVHDPFNRYAVDAVKSMHWHQVSPDYAKQVARILDDLFAAARDPQRLQRASQTMLRLQRAERSITRVIFYGLLAIMNAAILIFAIAFCLASMGYNMPIFAAYGLKIIESPLNAGLSIPAIAFLSGSTTLCGIFAVQNAKVNETIISIDPTTPAQPKPVIVK